MLDDCFQHRRQAIGYPARQTGAYEMLTGLRRSDGSSTRRFDLRSGSRASESSMQFGIDGNKSSRSKVSHLAVAVGRLLEFRVVL